MAQSEIKAKRGSKNISLRAYFATRFFFSFLLIGCPLKVCSVFFICTVQLKGPIKRWKKFWGV